MAVPQAARRPSNSVRTVAVTLVVRLAAAAATNTTLYVSTSGKLASHLIRPKSPNKSKFVMPSVLASTGSAELSTSRMAQLPMICVTVADDGFSCSRQKTGSEKKPTTDASHR